MLHKVHEWLATSDAFIESDQYCKYKITFMMSMMALVLVITIYSIIKEHVQGKEDNRNEYKRNK